jgi:hypothetical protein
MKHKTLALLVAGALGAAAATTASAQAYLDQETVRITRGPDWNPALADGICRLRVWVDDKARVQLRGDQVVVRTESGRRSFDEGSTCNQPLPAGGIDDFRVVAERARGGVFAVERPSGRNGHTGSLLIDDPQDGGAPYEVVVTWRNPGIYVAPLASAEVYPAYDETRACQERVRADFLARNPDDAYVEFTGPPARDAMGPRRDRIVGEAWARNRVESRPIAYECIVNERTRRVLSASYEVRPRARLSSVY